MITVLRFNGRTKGAGLLTPTVLLGKGSRPKILLRENGANRVVDAHVETCSYGLERGRAFGPEKKQKQRRSPATKCDRCSWKEATHKADATIKKHFSKYRNLCDYDFHILHAYASIMERDGKTKEHLHRARQAI